MARIVLSTFGSLGDLHPYLALAIALRDRGHDAVVATSEVYRQKVQGENLQFAAVRPDVGELLGNQEFIARLWHPRLGSEYLFREYLLPNLHASYHDLLAASQGADLVVTHLAAFAGPIAAERAGVPWISLILQPIPFFSALDPPVLAPAPFVRHLYRFGPFAFRVMKAAAQLRVKRWAKPILDLRASLGLPSADGNPLLEGQFSKLGTIALFSQHFAAPQADWPANTKTTGFVFYDKLGLGADNVDLELARFLETGPAPVLFTLGSSAVMHPGRFFEESIAAIARLGIRAILLVGAHEGATKIGAVSPNIHVAAYVPFSAVMPRSSVIVHQGGIGTTAQALRAGRPTVVVPWAHDQPDNADRVQRLGISRTIPRSRYKSDRVARELRTILDDPGYSKRAEQLGASIRSENGIAAACDAVESFIASSEPGGEPSGPRQESPQTLR